jgi:DNA-binding CsgD family transcriptional regulator
MLPIVSLAGARSEGAGPRAGREISRPDLGERTHDIRSPIVHHENMADQPGSRRTAARVLAVTLFGLAAAWLATGVGYALAGGISFAIAVASFTVTNGVIGLTLSACGALLAWHRPRNPVGWLFLAGGIAYAMSAGAIQLVGFGAAAGWNTGVLRLGASLFEFAWPLAIGLCVPMALLLFPDGRLPGPRWRWLVWTIAAEAVLFELMAASPDRQNLNGRVVSREREVLDLIAAGVRNTEIAQRISIAPKTVANHISAIFNKLQVADRNQAIILARDAGLGRNTSAPPACLTGNAARSRRPIRCLRRCRRARFSVCLFHMDTSFLFALISYFFM